MTAESLRSLAFVCTFVAIVCSVGGDSALGQGPPPPPTCSAVPGVLSYRGLLSGCSETTQIPCFAGEVIHFQFEFANPFFFQGSYAWLPAGGSAPIFTDVPAFDYQYISSGTFAATVVVFACVSNPTIASQPVRLSGAERYRPCPAKA
jgi:hypothetical protein